MTEKKRMKSEKQILKESIGDLELAIELKEVAYRNQQKLFKNHPERKAQHEEAIRKMIENDPRTQEDIDLVVEEEMSRKSITKLKRKLNRMKKKLNNM